jgi:hypothetical protein
MQKLFDFSPSVHKPLKEFFGSEKCEIIRRYAKPARGYFVVTDEIIKGGDTGAMRVKRMWWVVKYPTEIKRFAGRKFTYMNVSDEECALGLLVKAY